MIAQLEQVNLSQYRELVFCGYGEPTCALEVLLATCRYVRSVSDIKMRINTNGLSDLINGRPTAALFEGLMDTVSISLNAPDSKGYLEVTHPSFGQGAFEAMLKFAREVKQVVPRVLFTVVDIISAEDIGRCRALAEEMGRTF